MIALAQVRKCFVLCALCCCALLAKAQVPLSETYDCDFYKELVLPLRAAGENPSLDQSVFYSYRDQFTYWYKIVAKEDRPVTFQLWPINDSDSYSVFVYQYNGADFCKQVYHQTLKPAKPNFFSYLTPGSFQYDLSEKKFKAVKGSVYYIAVLNTSLNNCGHKLRLSDGKDTLRVRAVHIPCKRDLAELPVKQVAVGNSDSLKFKPPPEVKKDVVATSAEPLLLCVVKSKKTNAVLEFKPGVSDAEQNETELFAEGKGRWLGKVLKGATYKIRCAPMGYKAFSASISVQNGDTTTAEILLEPLKEGDAFVMKSIYFYPNTYALKKESAQDLQRLLGYLQNNENVMIEIQGHTNGDHRIARNKAYESLGEEWNFQGSAKELSQKRAQAIKKFLEANGVKPERLVPKGYGGKKPIILDPQNNDEGQMNIRVEVLILKT